MTKGKTNLISSCISQDGKLIAVSDAYRIRVFAIGYEPIKITEMKHDALKQLPGGLVLKFQKDTLVVGGIDNRVYLMDLQTYKVETHDRHLKKARPITLLSCSEDEKYIVSVDDSR